MVFALMPHAQRKRYPQMGHLILLKAFVVADINSCLHFPLLPTRFELAVNRFQSADMRSKAEYHIFSEKKVCTGLY